MKPITLGTLENILTLNEIKRRIYSGDLEFSTAMELVRGTWSNTGPIERLLWNSAAILLRPDAIVARRARRILPVLREHGLKPVAVRCIHLTRRQSAMIWRYQSNVMTSHRRRLMDKVMTVGPSIYIVLGDDSYRRTTPATSHVTYLKGPSIVAKRRALHLRSLVGPSVSNILSYIHASDDPADLLRELAVLFGRGDQLAILSEIKAGEDRTDEALALIAKAELYAPRGIFVPQHSEFIGNDELWMTLDDTEIRREWISIIDEGKRCVSYVSGESYNTMTATIPDDKRFLRPLDDHLISAEIGPGF